MGKSWENHLWMGYFSGMWWHNLRFGLKMCVWKWHPKKSHGFTWFWLSTCLHLEVCRHTRFPDFWWTAVYHLFWCSPDAAGFGPPIWLGYVTVYLLEMFLDFWPSNFIWYLGLPEKGEYIPHNLALQFTVLSVFKWGLILVVSCFQTNIYLAVWTWKSMCKLPT